MASGAILSPAQIGDKILHDTGRLEREETSSLNSNEVAKEQKPITGILKGGNTESISKATVTLICEESGTQFDTRNIRLLDSGDAKIGRCIKSGALPDEVQLKFPIITYIHF